MFHCQDGLFFEKAPHGDIRIIKTCDCKHPAADLSNLMFEMTVAQSSFASIIAAVCNRGYTTDTFYAAYEFLKEPPAKPKKSKDADGIQH